MTSGRGILKQHAVAIEWVQRLVDPLIAIAIYHALYVLNGFPVERLFYVVTFIATLIVFQKSNLYHSWRSINLSIEVKEVLKAWGGCLICIVAFMFVAGHSVNWLGAPFSIWALLVPVVMIVQRLILKIFLGYIRSQGRNIRDVVIVGVNSLGQHVFRCIQENPAYGLRVVGFFDNKQSSDSRCLLLGAIEDVPSYVSKHNIDCVYFTLPIGENEQYGEIISALGDTVASVHIMVDLCMIEMLKSRYEEFEGIPSFVLFQTPFFGLKNIIKIFFDKVMAAACLILFSPLLLLIAVAIKIDSPGPALFTQRRYGFNGEEMLVYKFRTMTVCEDGDQVVQAKKGDARITKVGVFLRRSSLDELPQLINVLKGDMSLVGPRPHAVAHNEYYRKLIRGYMLRHRIRPGITGWAQIHGFRGETDTLDKMERRVDYDLYYVRNWTLTMDFRILFSTIYSIVMDRNAY